MNIQQLSQQLLLKVKMNEPTSPLTTKIEQTSLDFITSSLDNDEDKKAFWINIYNAYYQILRKEFNLKNPEIFRNKAIVFSGLKLSLDDIEHGILRQGRIKWTLGYLRNPFLSRSTRKLMVSEMDYRFHFALNCGARSCPPIAFYSPDQIQRQLDMATGSFLAQETEINSTNQVVHVSRIFLWFLGDFGGFKGIRRIISRFMDVSLNNYTLKFKPYDWEEDLMNFQT